MSDVLQWPADLPQRFLDRGLQEKPGAVVVRTDMSSGPPKKRRRFTKDLRQIAGVMVMTEPQIELLEAFFYGSLGGGALDFLFLHPRTDALTAFSFASPPAYSKLGGGLWEVSISLEKY